MIKFNIGDVFLSESGHYYIHTTRGIGRDIIRFFLNVNTGELIGCGNSNDSANIGISILELSYCGPKGFLKERF